MPLSYSLIVLASICSWFASCFCVRPLAVRAAWIACFNSLDTVLSAGVHARGKRSQLVGEEGAGRGSCGRREPACSKRPPVHSRFRSSELSSSCCMVIPFLAIDGPGPDDARGVVPPPPRAEAGRLPPGLLLNDTVFQSCRHRCGGSGSEFSGHASGGVAVEAAQSQLHKGLGEGHMPRLARVVRPGCATPREGAVVRAATHLAIAQLSTRRHCGDNTSTSCCLCVRSASQNSLACGVIIFGC